MAAPLLGACLLATTAMVAPADAAAHVRCHLQDPRLTEASSLVDLGRWLVTANDSGHGPQLFVLDSRTCATVGVTTYADSVVDTESMAPAGPDAVWVGDTGDNRRVRDSIAVYRVPIAPGDHALTAPRYPLSYPDGPHDAEALVQRGGRLYVVTKGLLSGAIYQAPRKLSTDRTNLLRRVATAPGMVTDATMLRSGRGVLLRDYARAYLLALPGWKLQGSFRLPKEQQGEAIAAGPGGRVLVTSEGPQAPVLSVRVPGRLLRQVEGPSAGPSTGQVSGPDRSKAGKDRPEPGTVERALPLIGLAVVVLGGSWGLRRLRRSRMRRRR